MTVSGTVLLMWVRTSFSRHFMATGVSATGLKSFRVGVSDLLGTGMMMEDLYIRGTTAWDSERLKMSVYTPASCYPQAFSTLGCTPSGPAALCGFTFFRAFRTCVCVSPERLCPWGHRELLMVVDGSACRT